MPNLIKYILFYLLLFRGLTRISVFNMKLPRGNSVVYPQLMNILGVIEEYRSKDG